jgi:hypothetical protein
VVMPCAISCANSSGEPSSGSKPDPASLPTTSSDLSAARAAAESFSITAGGVRVVVVLTMLRWANTGSAIASHKFHVGLGFVVRSAFCPAAFPPAGVTEGATPDRPTVARSYASSNRRGRRATYPAVCSKWVTQLGNADRANRKSRCGRNRTNGWDVKWPPIRAWGQYHSRINWIDGRRIRAAAKVPQRKRPCRSRATARRSSFLSRSIRGASS